MARGAAGAAVRELARDVESAVNAVVRGREEVVALTLVALLSGGHLLIEDVPGVGKTLLAKSLATAVGGKFNRVQATPDLLPSDITGSSVYQPVDGIWEFHPGPIFANVVVVDEVNRATPRTQAAVLEAMEERQVTVDGVSRALPEPFFLIATQNPREHAGTFPLPDGQLDRFALTTSMGYPAPAHEADVLLGQGGVTALDSVTQVVTVDRLADAIDAVRRLHVERAVAEYVVALVAASRAHPAISLGASPRAATALLRAAQAHAAMDGHDHVTPHDVQALAVPVLAHRLVLRDGAGVDAAAAIVNELVGRVPVPRQ
ncbi:MAG TPA: MoxR family ATPase [Acidimicrobiales bacterium]|nr:MoxR family ATPase [Acidimicrobiales bacterium]